MLNKSQKQELTGLLYPAFFVPDPFVGYSPAQLHMMFDKASSEQLRTSCSVLQTALALDEWDMREVLPGTPRTNEELRLFARRALEQLRALLDERTAGEVR
jgi:hypothetical protein